MSGRPTIRILHNLARSGGTIVSRCLACMDGVALLSEVHPTIGGAWNDPRAQAKAWYGVDVPPGLTFADTVMVLEMAFRARGLALVLRSWDFVDFVPSQHNATPAMRSTLAEALRERCEIREAWLTRAPGPQFASTRRFLVGDAVLTDGGINEGWMVYAAHARPHSVAYEDFVRLPNWALSRLCSALDLPFDADWSSKWQSYINVTGDIWNQVGRTTIG